MRTFYSGPALLTTEHCSFFLRFFNQIAFNSKKHKKSLLRDASKQKQISTSDRSCFADLFALFCLWNRSSPEKLMPFLNSQVFTGRYFLTCHDHFRIPLWEVSLTWRSPVGSWKSREFDPLQKCQCWWGSHKFCNQQNLVFEDNKTKERDMRKINVTLYTTPYTLSTKNIIIGNSNFFYGYKTMKL